MTLTFGSLFAGVGGFDLGMEQAGWKCAWQVEWDKHCQQVLRYHWPDTTKHGDVSTASGHTLQPVDCITFGSPCQDLSVAGKRAGLEGNRSSLFHEAIRIIKEMRHATKFVYPRWAVWENVVGALNSNNGHDFATVIDSLAKAGALVIEWAVLDAQHFGVAQRRRRVFVVACFDPATSGRCPEPLLPVAESLPRHIAQSRTQREEFACSVAYGLGANHRVSGTLGNPKSRNDLDSSGAYVATFSKSKRAQTSEDDETWVEGAVAPTLNAFDQGDTRATVVAVSEVPMAVRRLTPVECERLMGWPDDHTRYGIDENGRTVDMADSPRYRMIGNGVASPVAAWVGRQLAQVDQ